MILLAVQALVGHRYGNVGTLVCTARKDKGFARSPSEWHEIMNVLHLPGCEIPCTSLKATLGQYGKGAQFVGSHNVRAVTAVTGATKNPRYPVRLAPQTHTPIRVYVCP